MVADIVTGALESLVLFVTVTTTAIAIPPASAPLSRYQHVVSVSSAVAAATVLAVLGTFVARRRWAATAIQVAVVLAAGASILFLHRTRLSGGLVGY